MKKLTLLLSVMLLGITTYAQFPYTLSYRSEAYAPLGSGATSLNNGMIWDDENYAVNLPFSFQLGGAPVSRLNLMLGAPAVTLDTQGNVTGFILSAMDIADRGNLTGATSLSPVSYQTTGTAPNRIFKTEIANAGLYNELDMNNTMNDFLNMQVWYYETSNVVEIHFGTSQLTNPQDYYNFGNGPLFGYAKNLDEDNFAFDAIYTLAGNPVNPTIDSVNLQTGSVNVLGSYPANGTVYKFTPRPTTGINTLPSFKGLAIYPTVTTSGLHIDLSGQQSADYELVGIDGRSTGIKGSIAPGANLVDVSALASGMYLLRVENKENRSISRFMKK